MDTTSDGKNLFIEKTKERTYGVIKIEKHTFMQNARYAMNSKIYTEEHNGEKCYVIEGKENPYNVYESAIDSKTYISKDTVIIVQGTSRIETMPKKIKEDESYWKTIHIQ